MWLRRLHDKAADTGGHIDVGRLMLLAACQAHPALNSLVCRLLTVGTETDPLYLAVS